MVEAFYVLYIVNSSDERTKRQNVRTKNIFFKFYLLLLLFVVFVFLFFYSIFV
jgi:predicted nucleic acid-binding Zn ribbon protein